MGVLLFNLKMLFSDSCNIEREATVSCVTHCMGPHLLCALLTTLHNSQHGCHVTGGQVHFSQAVEMLLGTWQLSVADSKYGGRCTIKCLAADLFFKRLCGAMTKGENPGWIILVLGFQNNTDKAGSRTLPPGSVELGLGAETEKSPNYSVETMSKCKVRILLR